MITFGRREGIRLVNASWRGLWILLTDLSGGYKGVYLKISHWVIHLFCVLFCICILSSSTKDKNDKIDLSFMKHFLYISMYHILWVYIIFLYIPISSTPSLMASFIFHTSLFYKRNYLLYDLLFHPPYHQRRYFKN